MDRFDAFFDRLMGSEGGYVNHPSDHGGETKWGISKRAYPALDIKNLTREQAKEIYRRDYYAAVGGDIAPDPLAFQLFDAAVNHGVSRAIKLFQQAASLVPDGVVGPATTQALLQLERASPKRRLEVAVKFHRLRSRFYTSQPKAQKIAFGDGWANRQADNLFFLVEDFDV